MSDINWNDQALGSFALLVGVIVFGTLAYLWRARKLISAMPPEERWAVWLEKAGGAVFYMSLFASVLTDDWLEGVFGDNWKSLAASIAITLAGLGCWMLAVMNLMRVRKKRGTDNPIAAPVAKPSLTKEEKRVGARLNVFLLLAAITMLAPLLSSLYFLDVDKLMFAPLLAVFLYCTAVLAALIYIFIGYWPGSLSREARLTIDAPPEAVWDLIEVRERAANWNPSVRAIVLVPGSAKAFDIRHYHLDPCVQCGLTLPPSTEGYVTRTEVSESRPPEYLRLRSTMHGDGSARKAMMKWEEHTYTLKETAQGGTEIFTRSVAHKPKVLFALVLLFGDACGEHLRTLKGKLEGRPSGTIFEASAERVEALHKAAKFCSCPAPVSASEAWIPG